MADQRRFPETRWTQIARAGNPGDPTCREALEQLVEAYWQPAFRYIKAAGRLEDDDARDITQDFFARFLERRHVERLDPDAGSFRGFLKRSIRNFLIDKARRRTVRAVVPLDETEELATRDEAEAAFEREWTRTVMSAALAQLARKLEEVGLAGHYESFEAYFLPDGMESAATIDWKLLDSETQRRTYQQVADRLGKTHTTVRKHLEFCRKELRALVREQIADYVVSEEELEQEYRKIVGA